MPIASQVLKADAQSMTYLAFSPDGLAVAAGSGSQPAIFLWDTVTGVQKGILSGFERTVACLRFLPANNRLLSSGFCSIRLWDTSTFVELKSARAAFSWVYALGVSAD